MKNMFDFLKNSPKQSLEEVIFKALPVGNITADVRVAVTDSLSTLFKADTGVGFLLSRQVELSPECLFSLKVSIIIFYKLLDGIEFPKEITDAEWKNMVVEQDESALTSAMGKISLLIGEITRTTSDSALITPPGIGKNLKG